MNCFMTVALCVAAFFCKAHPSSLKPLTIGIVLPAQHQALDDIVRGYTETLTSLYGDGLTFRIENAQGDMTLQKAMIQKLHQQAVDIIVPVSTTTTQMTLKMVKDIPIVSLASAYDKNDPHMKAPNLTGVTDEFPPELLLAFLKKFSPEIKKVVLIHSANDKVMKTVEDLIQSAKKHEISVHPFMLHALSDMYTLKGILPKDASVILILKDSFVASGISTLIQVAQKTGRILMTSDEGTVKSGAHFALGVSEYEIGKKGAEQTLKILQGASPQDIPFVVFESPQVYVNEKTALQAPAVYRAAESLGYTSSAVA